MKMNTFAVSHEYLDTTYLVKPLEIIKLKNYTHALTTPSREAVSKKPGLRLPAAAAEWKEEKEFTYAMSRIASSWLEEGWGKPRPSVVG